MVGVIQERYGIEDFFQNAISNYKQLASIYKIFEYREQENPIDHAQAKITLIESIVDSKPNTKMQDVEVIAESAEDLDVMVASMTLMVDKFNKKYSTMSPKQQSILKEYFECESNSPKMKYFLQENADIIKRDITKVGKRITDPVLKIKVNEVTKLLEEYSSIKKVEDNHVSSILRFYGLVDDLNELVNRNSGVV